MTAPADSPKPMILVIDDSEDIRMLAKALLEDEGYRVVLAQGGIEGVAAFEAETPDCVLLDVRMPVMDGFEVCRRIRALPRSLAVPILFLTALRDVDTFDEALRAGGDDFLTKPIRPTELAVRVQTTLKMRRMSVELREHFDLIRQQSAALMRVQLQKQRLMAFVIHDLKTPVTVMDLHAQVLLGLKGLPDTVVQPAMHIRAAARNLNRMIMNLLDLSKSDEGSLVPHLATVDLRALVGGVLEDLNVDAHSREVSLACEIGVASVRADDDLLRRTVTNLVENAIRHAPAGSTIVVRSAPATDGTDLSVSDTGLGVPVEMREKIFESFVQLENGAGHASSRSGRGLGLAFCKVAVEAQGGRIWVADAEPGATFHVRLPA